MTEVVSFVTPCRPDAAPAILGHTALIECEMSSREGPMAFIDELNTEQQQLIRKHLDGVIAANSKVNLTRIDTVENGMLLHIEDSLSALPEIEAAPEGRYGDMGSGGGFPGIPLAVATGRSTTLIDARQKKMVVMQEIIEDLGLQDQVDTFAGRAELLAVKHPGEFAVLTARALAKLPVLLELASPLLQHDGQLICYKAQVEQQELDDAKRVQKATGMKLASDREFMLGDNQRRILVFQKYAEPAVKLPRTEGSAQKNPL